MLIGLLAVDPHRLFLYWETPDINGLTMSLFKGSARISVSQEVKAAGSLYLAGLEPGNTYRVELRRARHLVARSSDITLPRAASGRTAGSALAPAGLPEENGGAGSSFPYS